MQLFARINKVDVASRTVFGRAVQEVVDKTKEIFDYASSKPLFEQWSANICKLTDGKSLGNIRVMHGKAVAGKATEVIFHDDERAIDIAAKIIDDNEWKKVEEGCYTGFSIGGSYAKKWPDDEHPDCTRYTADPAEISIVDQPCVPTATFSLVRADGQSEVRKFIEPKEPTDEEKAAKAAADKLAADVTAKADPTKDNAEDDDDPDPSQWDSEEDDDTEDDSDAAEEDDKQETADLDEEEKAVMAQLTALFTAKKLKPAHVLRFAEADVKKSKKCARIACGFALRRALLDPGLTNGAVEALAARHLPEAERSGDITVAIKALDARAMPVASYLARMVKAEGTPVRARAKRFVPGYVDTISDEDASKLLMAQREVLKALVKGATAEHTDFSTTKAIGKFADPANKKYPLDTQPQIVAAWNYINKPKNAGKYTGDQIKAMKACIVSAWKTEINADGPPAAKDGSERIVDKALRKGLYGVAQFAMTVQSLWEMARACAAEQEYEKDSDSLLPARLNALAAEAGEILCEMAEEETQEEGAGKAEMVAALRKEFVPTSANALLLQMLTKAARYGKADAEMLQKCHDLIGKMGAACATEKVAGTDLAKFATAVADLRKTLGVDENTDVTKALAVVVEKARKWDATPADPKGMLKAVGKAEDVAPASREVPSEIEDLIKKAEKGDAFAAMRLTHLRPNGAPPKAR